MITISVVGKKDEYFFTLTHKVTIVMGKSGCGKSSFAKAATDNTGAYKQRVSDSKYKLISIMDNNGWYDNYQSLVTVGNTNYIFIFDDMNCILSREFSKVFSEDIKNYYIIINRFANFGLESLDQIPISVDSIFTMGTSGRKHWLEPRYIFDSCTSPYYDCVVTEDSAKGFEFLRKYNDNISTALSKSQIVQFLKDNRYELKGKRVLVFADLASFGSYVGALIGYASKAEIQLYLLDEYECFEYLLLKSNLLKLSDKPLSNSAIARYSSFEKLYEVYLALVTKDTPYYVGHDNSSKLSECYYEDCCTKPSRFTKRGKSDNKFCNVGLSGNKLDELFKGTIWESTFQAIKDSNLVRYFIKGSKI